MGRMVQAVGKNTEQGKTMSGTFTGTIAGTMTGTMTGTFETAPTQPPSGGIAAVRIDDLTKTLGISGHIGTYNQSAYAWNAHTLADAQWLNVRIWRDGYVPELSAVFQSLANAGLKHILIGPAISHCQAIAAMKPGALLCAEGMNEPAGFGYKDDWRPVSEFQAGLYSGIKGDAIFNNTLVLTPTNVGEEPNNWGLQYLTVPHGPPAGVLASVGLKYAEVYCIHIYPMWFGGFKSPQYVDPASGNVFDLQLSSDFELTWKNKFPGSPLAQLNASLRIITETNPGVVGPQSPGSDKIDFITCGKCLLNGFLNSFEQGYLAFCVYTLYEDGTGHGIMHGPERPASSGVYLHNFTQPLVDSGGDFALGSLDFSIAGLPSTAKSQLFQKSNGDFFIIVWNNVKNWNHANGEAISIAPTNVVINFASNHSTINTYDPTIKDTPAAITWNANTATIGLKDYPLIVEVIG